MISQDLIDLFCRTLSISLKMFHTEFFKGKSLQEVNTNGSEGAVLNIIVDGKFLTFSRVAVTLQCRVLTHANV